MREAVQEDLRAWVELGDRDRGGLALDAISREWRPRVRLFLQNPGEDEVEEVLSEAISALCVAMGGAPRALAPAVADAPAAWRRKVLKNFLIDRARRSGRRAHAVQGQAAGWTPEVEAEAWRRAKATGVREVPKAEAPEARDEADPVALLALAAKRRQALALLPALRVRRRVTLALALRADPSAFARELAADLREPASDTLSRIAAALEDPERGAEALPLASVRVCWPEGPERKAREAARKTLERAVQDLQALLGVAP